LQITFVGVIFAPVFLGRTMFVKILRSLAMVHLVLGVLVATLVMTEPTVRRYGDNLQVALPLLAWGCSATSGGGKEYAVRFITMLGITHGSKAVLGDASLNVRPNGGDKGFPSGHTSAAAFGASSLVHDCLRKNPVAKGIVLLSAAFVGGSRIEVRAHTIWQVLAGGLLGWGADRLLRSESAARRRVVAVLTRAGTAVSRVLTLSARAIYRAVLVGATCLLVVPTAIPARAEIEISVYTGGQTAPHSTIVHSTLGEDTVGWLGKSFEMPPYWGLRATTWRNDRFGYGVEFNHAKVYADNPSAYGYDVLEMTDGINILTANVWRRWQTDSRWTPYVGAGIGVAIPHVEVQPTGEELTFGYQLTGPAAQLVAGAAWELNAKWSVFGEYKGTWSSHVMDLDSGGTLKTDIITNALNLGLSYKF
jgi:lipid A oxidase